MATVNLLSKPMHLFALFSWMLSLYSTGWLHGIGCSLTVPEDNIFHIHEEFYSHLSFAYQMMEHRRVVLSRFWDFYTAACYFFQGRAGKQDPLRGRNVQFGPVFDDQQLRP